MLGLLKYLEVKLYIRSLFLRLVDRFMCLLFWLIFLNGNGIKFKNLYIG